MPTDHVHEFDPALYVCPCGATHESVARGDLPYALSGRRETPRHNEVVAGLLRELVLLVRRQHGR